MFRIGFIASFFICLAAPAAWAQSHAIAMHGQPQLAENFNAYSYANPNAPQGGQLKQAQIGSFDSLNPFSIRGNAARNIRERVFESLLDRHYGEAFALYGLLAESLSPMLKAWIVAQRADPGQYPAVAHGLEIARALVLALGCRLWINLQFDTTPSMPPRLMRRCAIRQPH